MDMFKAMALMPRAIEQVQKTLAAAKTLTEAVDQWIDPDSPEAKVREFNEAFKVELRATVELMKEIG